MDLLAASVAVGRGRIMPENEKKVSKAQQRAVNKYVRNNYDRILVTLPKGQKELIQAAAAAEEPPESVNAYIRKAIALRLNNGHS